VFNIIKKDMACKNCKKNAKSMVSKMKDIFSTPQKPKTSCQKNREKEQQWLKTPEAKSLLEKAKPNNIETIIIWGLGFIPLIIGYVTIVRFIINLF